MDLNFWISDLERNVNFAVIQEYFNRDWHLDARWWWTNIKLGFKASKQESTGYPELLLRAVHETSKVIEARYSLASLKIIKIYLTTSLGLWCLWR